MEENGSDVIGGETTNLEVQEQVKGDVKKAIWTDRWLHVFRSYRSASRVPDVQW